MKDRNREWTEYFSRRLAEAEKKLADFNSAVAKSGLSVRYRYINGERDVTDQERKHLEDTVEEYRLMLRELRMLAFPVRWAAFLRGINDSSACARTPHPTSR